MTKPEYEVGYRFTVMNTVKCEIIEVCHSTDKTEYIFQLFDNPVFKSIVTEYELKNILLAQKH